MTYGCGSRTASVVLCAAASVLAAGTAGSAPAAASSVDGTNDPYTTPVPDVEGRTWPVAEKIIGGWPPHPGWDAYLLESPSPVPEVGDAVIYVVVQGQPFDDTSGEFTVTQVPAQLGVVMPDLSGLTRDGAQKELTSVGLGDATVVPADAAGDQVVRGQVPPPGELVAFGAAQVLFDKYVSVPSVLSMRVADARSVLAGAGLLLAGPSSGVVVAQQPLAGTRVVEGSTVTVSTAPGLVVPNVVGLSVREARTALDANGLRLRAPPGTDGDERVTGQSPAPNTPARRGQVIEVSVGEGQVRVPNIVGLDVDQARDRLTSRELVLDAPASAGEVLAQQPPAGSVVAPGSSVTVTLRDSDGRVPVPNLLGMSPEQAQASLDRLGLRLEVPDGSGPVVEQTPAPLTLVAAGSTVTIGLRTDDQSVALLVVAALATGFAAAATAASLAARRWSRRRWVRRRLLVRATSRLEGPVPAGAAASRPRNAGSDETWVRERLTASATSRIEREW